MAMTKKLEEVESDRDTAFARLIERGEELIAVSQQRDRLLACIREHRSEAQERGATANDRWLYGMAERIERDEK